MKDMAMFMGVFIVGYGLTMGLLYIVLSVFPKRKDRSVNKNNTSERVMKVSGNSKNGNGGLRRIEKSVKMKLANG